MAAKKKADKKADPTEQQADEAQQQAAAPEKAIEGKAISGAKMKKLMALRRRTKQDVDTINGEFGSELKAAYEADNLHRGAANWIFRLDRLEPEALREWMDNFEYLLDVSGLKKRAESVMRMPLEGEEEGNVATFPGRKEAAE